MAFVDDHAVGAAVGADVGRADEEPGHVLDRALRRRQADALQRMLG